MLPAGFEPAIPASERQQTHALHRAATGIGNRSDLKEKGKVIPLQARCGPEGG